MQTLAFCRLPSGSTLSSANEASGTSAQLEVAGGGLRLRGKYVHSMGKVRAHGTIPQRILRQS